MKHYKGCYILISKLSLFLAVVLGLISYSSTFIVGFILWLILEIYLSIKTRDKMIELPKVGLLIFIIGVCSFLLFVLFDPSQTVINIVMKALNEFNAKIHVSNFSGKDRTQTFKMLIEVWEKSPIFGVGFGSSRGKDLFSTWLCNTGITGIIIIFGYITF